MLSMSVHADVVNATPIVDHVVIMPDLLHVAILGVVVLHTFDGRSQIDTIPASLTSRESLGLIRSNK
jgi:hypothetical protein